MDSSEASSSADNAKRDRQPHSDSSSESSPDPSANASKKSRLNSVDEASSSQAAEVPTPSTNSSPRARRYRPRILESSSEDEQEVIENIFPSQSEESDESAQSYGSDTADSNDERPNYHQSLRRKKILEKTVETEVTKILEKPKPKGSWNGIKELEKRQFGQSANQHAAYFFRQKYYDSLDVAQTFQLHTTLEYHTGCVNCLEFEPKGHLLASGSDDLQIAVWDWAQHKKVFSYDTGHRSNVFQCRFLGGDCRVVSCARDGQVRLAEFFPSGGVNGTRRLAKHSRAAHQLAVRPDNPNEVLSSGQDGLVMLIDIRQPKPHKLVSVETTAVARVPLNSISSNPADAHHFCVAGQDPHLRIYDTRRTSSPYHTFAPAHVTAADDHASVTCVVYSHNGDSILASYMDNDIFLYETGGGITEEEPSHRYSGHRNSNTVKCVSFFSPNNRYIISGSDCGNIFFWDRDTEAVVNCFQGADNGIVNVLEPHPTEPYLATSGLDDDVKIWSPSHTQSTMREDTETILKSNLRKRITDRNSTTFGIDALTLLAFFQDMSRRNNGSQSPRTVPPQPNDGLEDYPTLEDSEQDSSDSDSSDSYQENSVPCATS